MNWTDGAFEVQICDGRNGRPVVCFREVSRLRFWWLGSQSVELAHKLKPLVAALGATLEEKRSPVRLLSG